MSDSPLESEDLENVPLVRMEDVQPSRDRVYEVVRIRSDDESDEVIETCVVDGIDYDNECIVNNDDDSNIGSMVSIKSEVTEEETETIIPDVVDGKIIEYNSMKDTKAPSSWPTLEILPGGVIKKPVKLDSNLFEDDDPSKGLMMFACAKCPQQFKRLVCLVKHVKWHEDEEKKQVVCRVEYEKKGKCVCPLHCSKKISIRTHNRTHKKKSPKKLKT